MHNVALKVSYNMKTSPSLALFILFWNIIHTSLMNMTCFILMCVFYSISCWPCSHHCIHTGHNNPCKNHSTIACWTNATQNSSSFGLGSDEVSQKQTQHREWGSKLIRSQYQQSWWSQRRALWGMSAICCRNERWKTNSVDCMWQNCSVFSYTELKWLYQPTGLKN